MQLVIRDRTGQRDRETRCSINSIIIVIIIVLIIVLIIVVVITVTNFVVVCKIFILQYFKVLSLLSEIFSISQVIP